jgi:arsenite methyltransferase
MEVKSIKEAVKERFGMTAKQAGSCCFANKSGHLAKDSIQAVSKVAGYSDKDLKSVPDGANLGLGCGNPVALAALKEGDIVLDLGSGAGFDCFLAANIVGDNGRVIGVDMTLEMIEKARENAKKDNRRNVEFRLGEIENLPVESASVDAVISNCVVNLSTDKQKVFHEAFRVLKPGGTLMVSDMLLLKDLPEYIHDSIDAYVVCIAGAMRKDDYVNAIKKAGFEEVTIVSESHFPAELIASQPVIKEFVDKMNIPFEELRDIGESVVSMKIAAKKTALH